MSSDFPNVPTEKAYKNLSFLNSEAARMIRIQCELTEPHVRLDQQKVDHIIMMFGSARARSKTEYQAVMEAAQAKVAAAPGDVGLFSDFSRLEKQGFLVEFYETASELSRMLTAWNMERVKEGHKNHLIGTGGGPGMMTAANQGAALAKGESVGFAISLPFENGNNPYVTPTLAFEFHYFFTRKFWMAFRMSALIALPGGIGTCDELFELMTLIQTKKMTNEIPLVLIGKKFWNDIIKWDKFLEYGMIAQSDLDRMFITDSAIEAFEYITSRIV